MSAVLKHPAAPALAGFGVALVTLLVIVSDAGATPRALWTAVFFAILTALAWTDAVTETVPDGLTIALVVTGILHASTLGVALLPIAGPAVLLLLIGVLHGAVTGDRGWLGSGDYFLLAGAIAWFGPIAIFDVLAITAVGLLAHCVLTRRATIAVAPSLAIACALIWIGGPIL